MARKVYKDPQAKIAELEEALRDCRDTLVLCSMSSKNPQIKKSVDLADEALGIKQPWAPGYF